VTDTLDLDVDPFAEDQGPGLVDYATYAMSEGWDPIPVWGVNADGVCACKNGLQCKSPGKHPVELKWSENERMTKREAYEWFAAPGHPTNVGLRTGKASSFWALDIDPKSGGNESLLSLEAQYGALPQTRTHRTGSGGRHYLFKLPADFDITNSRGRLPRGIDVRGNGGFIVAPGSVTGVGTYRTEVAAPIVPAPEWLLNLLRPQTLDRQIEVVESVAYESLDPAAQEKAHRYLDAAVTAEIARLEAMKTEATSDMSQYRGEPWNHTTYEVCCNLLELAQSQWLPFGIDDVKSILMTHAPTDRGFTMADVMGRLASAANKVRGKDRPMPASITQDSWALLTAGVERFVPKASDGSVVESWPEESWNQVGNAKRTIRMASGRLAWVPERSGWYECGLNGVWAKPPVSQRDDVAAKWCARAMEAAVALEVHNYDEAPGTRVTPSGKEVEDASRREKFMKFMEESSKVEMHSAVAIQLRRRASDFGLEVERDRFDAVPHEFACANGVVDLRNGEIRPIRQEDYISISSKVAYDPEMPIPHFQRFLETSHPDPEVRDFLQKVLGYSMTNEVKEHKMFIHYGASTANGKSVLMNVLKAILGDHLSPASEKTIIRQRSQSSQRIGQDMVDLVGPRFLMLNETGEGGILDSETVKSITSADLRADRPHAQANVQYRVTGKIHLVTNHLPHITPDPAMRRRLTVIPWTQSFVNNPDPNLESKLMGELPGILAWLVQGSIRWYADFQANQKTGLAEPVACAQELDKFFEEEDEIGTWIKDRCMTLDVDSDPKSWTPNKDLYTDYQGWRIQQALQGAPLSVNAFGRRLTSKGHDVKVAWVESKTTKVRPLRLNATLGQGFPI
jgi:P4 family phage/plasmid primase-like protien